jgi:hypothetical protein
MPAAARAVSAVGVRAATTFSSMHAHQPSHNGLLLPQDASQASLSSSSLGLQGLSRQLSFTQDTHADLLNQWKHVQTKQLV